MRGSSLRVAVTFVLLTSTVFDAQTAAQLCQHVPKKVEATEPLRATDQGIDARSLCFAFISDTFDEISDS